MAFQQDYLAFGLHLRSEIPLPELAVAPGGNDGLPVVTIRIGAVPENIDDPRHSNSNMQVAHDDFLLTAAGAGRYRVRGGEEIVVEPSPGAPERSVSMFLLGSAVGVLCHQRGLLPLHACAVEVDGGAMAFVGESGAGKSTLAAYLHDRGYRLLCDDVCVIGQGESGTPVAWPGVRRIKLWQDALTALRGGHGNLEPVMEGQDKYYVPVTSVSDHRPLPLKRIYVLDNADAPEDAGITRVIGASAINAVITQTYRRGIADKMGTRQRHFRQGAAMLKSVGIFTFRRQRGFDVFEREAARLEQHMRDG